MVVIGVFSLVMNSRGSQRVTGPGPDEPAINLSSKLEDIDEGKEWAIGDELIGSRGRMLSWEGTSYRRSARRGPGRAVSLNN
jgi:hypothetical protein